MLTIIEKVLLLQELTLFSDASSDQLAEVAAMAEELRLAPRDVLELNEETSHKLYLLLQGRMRLGAVRTEGQEKTRQALNLWSFFAGEHRALRAEALEDCLLLAVSRDDLVNLLTSDPDFCWGVFQQVIRQHKPC